MQRRPGKPPLESARRFPSYLTASKTQRQMQDKRLNPNRNDENDACDDSVWILPHDFSVQ